MNIPAIENYLFETGQISALAKRQACMLSNTIDDENLQKEAHLLLLLNLAALGRGAPRAPERFLLQPLENNIVQKYLDAYAVEYPDLDPEWKSEITDPDILKEALKIIAASVASNQRLKPITGAAPEEIDTSKYPLLVIGTSQMGACIGFSRYWRAATSLEEALCKRLEQPKEMSDKKTENKTAEALTSVFSTDSILDKGRRFHYRQVAAAALAVRTPFLIVSGGPGTGKTWVVLQIIRTLIRVFPEIAPDRIVLCAPTGKAKARLGGTIDNGIDLLEKNAAGSGTSERAIDLGLKNLQRKTLHGLLGMRPDGSMKYTKRNPLPHQVIVVDEASMVDLHLFAALMDAADPKCRILLVGDMHQLAPVEAGAVLGDLTGRFDGTGFPTLTSGTADWIKKVMHDTYEGDAPSMVFPASSKEKAGRLADHAIILTESHRSVKEILDLSARVNFGDVENALKTIHANSPVTKLDDREGIGPVGEWFREHFTKDTINKTVALKDLDLDATGDPASPETSAKISEVLDIFEGSRILTLANTGPRGRTAINDLSEKYLRPKLQGGAGGRFYHGQQVILSRNLHDLDLFNGDTGMVVQSKNGGLKVIFRRGRGDSGYSIHSLERLSGMEPAFAMTVHKAQGSEFGEVLLVLPEYRSPLLTRQILYTGITRAKTRVCILGTENMLRIGIDTKEERAGGIELD